MSRKLLAVFLSSALVMTSVAAGAAEPGKPAPAPASQTASTAKNQPPLPPGGARIKKAQGLEDDDLGPGVIIAGIVVATGVLVWLMFGTDDDDSSSGTGTN